MNIVLASTSRYRQNLLARLGYNFESTSPLINESDYDFPTPQDKALELAELKAKSVQHLFSKKLIIGSDQVVACDGTILSKPGNKNQHRQQLEFLSNKTHQLHTGVAILLGEFKISWIVSTSITFRNLSLKEIEAYVELEEALDCAGGYKIESKGISLMRQIVTSDPTSIEGLPLLSLHQELLVFVQNT